MTKIYVDDKRPIKHKVLQGYEVIRTYQDCILLLTVFKNDIEEINLDYELGDSKSGFDILVYMKEHNINPKCIVIHSTHKEGVQKMKDYIKVNFPEAIYKYEPALDIKG